MFSGLLSGATFKGTDPDVERGPPPRPTPLAFPRHKALPTTTWTDSNPPPDFQSLFTKVLRPTDLSVRHLQALNIDTPSASSSLQDLLPVRQDGTSHISPTSPKRNHNASPCAEAATSNPAETRKAKELSDRLAELRVNNDAAFRAITKLTKEGVKPPRLAYLRKFWEGLENMSQYWDCSLDNYYETTTPEKGSDDGFEDPSRPKRARIDTLDLNAATRNPPSSPATEPTSEHHENIDAPAASGSNTGDSPQAAPPEEAEAIPIPIPRYKGRRTSTGRDMPPAFLTSTLTAFVEAAVWPFQCAVTPPRRMPIVQIGKLNVPVKLTAGVYRTSDDRVKARQGWVEGPLLGLLGRGDTDFGADRVGNAHNGDGSGWERPSGIDMLRETSALLEIAQERRREKQREKKPGEGEWWTTKPRWGGGRGGGVGSEEGNADENNDIVTAIEESVGLKKYSRRRPKKSPGLLWKELKCGSGIWDPKTVYKAIGKEPGSDWDEVFLLSSLNHHISILRLTVHEAYLDYLTEGFLPDPLPEDSAWCRPRLQRSEWFDFFDEERRVEAFLALWGLMHYLTRETASQQTQEGDKGEKE